MGFKKDIIIFENKTTKVYINQCHDPNRKTNIYAVRRNDKTGLAHLLGIIKFSGAWRQYIFEPDSETGWSAGCLQGVVDFLHKINKEWRNRHNKPKVMIYEI